MKEQKELLTKLAFKIKDIRGTLWLIHKRKKNKRNWD